MPEYADIYGLSRTRTPDEIRRFLDRFLPSRIESADGSVVEVGCALEERKADPTGVGDAFRAGVLAGMSWEVGWERCAQLGSMLATLTIETVGTQEYSLESEGFLARLEDAYGPDAMAEIAPHLRSSVR